ncbi:MAG: hypothetical protein RIB59_12125 [Rhodospirillales bacterium]
MNKLGLLVIAGLLLSGCVGTPESIEAFYSEACEYDSLFQYHKPGSPTHEFCMELARSGIEPWEDLHGGDADSAD